MDVTRSLSASAANDSQFSPHAPECGHADEGVAAGHGDLRFRQLADAMPQMVWIARANGYHEYFNRRWYEYTGATNEQSHGHTWQRVIHPDDQPEILRRWQHSFATNAPYEIKCRILRASDGAYRWHLCRALPQADETGRVRHWYGTSTDIHETRQTERRLAQQLNFTRGITDSLAQGLYAIDCDGLATFINPAAERMLGWTADEFIGKDVHQVIHFQHADHSPHARENCLLLDVIRTGQIVRADDDVFTTRTGTLVPVSYSSAPVVEDGKVAGAVVTFQDITDRKRQEQALLDSQQALLRYSEQLEQRVADRTAELRDINARLQSSNRELQDFASVASHDLQEPLRKIQAFGDRLAIRAGSALGADGEDYLRRMKNAAGRMQTLISDLLDFSRVTTKAQPFTSIDLHQIAADVLVDLEAAVEQSGGCVELVQLPRIDADPLQMRQLLQNLIGNALKFRRADTKLHVRVYGMMTATTAPGGAAKDEVGVEVGTEVAVESCQILVEDNGIGFDEKYLDRIFNVFQRLHGRNAYEGTGIGLAVCRKIAERHGGSITARSKPNEGSTFIVTLPARHKDATPQPRTEHTNAD